MAHSNNLISKVQLPGADGTTVVYDIHDASAIHSLEDLNLASVMQFKGTDTDANIQKKTGATEGDVWLATDTNKEYVWTGSKWEPLGNVHDAAASDHIHTATVSGANQASKVTGTVAVPTVQADAVSVPVVDIEEAAVTASKVKTAGSVVAGDAAAWGASVSGGVLSFTWTPNAPTTVTLPTFDSVTASKVAQGSNLAASKVTVGAAQVDIDATAAAQTWSGSATVFEPTKE